MVAGLKRAASGPAGALQLYSSERGASQALNAPVGCFACITPEGRSDPANLFAFVLVKDGEGPKLNIIEVGRAKDAPGAAFRLSDITLPAAADAAGDFPTAMQASNSQGLLYIFTRMGYVFVFDIQSGAAVFRAKAADAPIFAAAPHEGSGGVLALTAKTGTLLLTTLDNSNVVNYVSNTLRKPDLAMSLAGRLGLGGADELYKQNFNSKLASGDVVGAAQLAAKSSGDVLRNADTIARLQSMPAEAGKQPPIMQYFAALMKAGKLNKAESVALARPALEQGRAALVDKWMKEGKITGSAQLGDMVSPYDSQLAQTIYLDSGEAHDKVVQAFVTNGQADKIVPYARKHGFQPNYEFLLQNIVHQDPRKAQELASALVKNPEGPLIAKDRVVEIFMQLNRLQECTSFLLDALDGDRAEEGYLQTKLLELNLLGGAPQVAEAILASDSLHHFDKATVARLCEQKGLVNRALEFYEELEDIKRCLQRAQGIPEAFWLSWFGTLTPDTALECVGVLLQNRANEAVVVKIATQFSEQLGPVNLAELFETAKAQNGLYYYLGAIVNTSEVPEVHLKYIQSAVRLQQWPEVERVCRDSTVYNAEEVKDFLIECELKDPRPLIHVCDRFGFVEELTAYLNKRGLHRFIEVYVSSVSPAKGPAVIGKLLDLDADEDFIKRILGAVRRQCSVEELVGVVEERNRLRLLQPFLEANIAEGDQEAATHNAIGKIYITLNKEPQQFLKNNQFYDSRVIGKFCERLDPFLAFLAYKRAGGDCDDELLEVTNANGLFKDQARYLVEKMDMNLWSAVLQDDNPHRPKVVEQVTSTALPETKDPDRVSVTVKAFMAAELHEGLVGLLEKLVLHGGDFADNRNLQNLLIITAIKCSVLDSAVPGRTMEYINRLDNFDGDEIAEIALREEYGLLEEAFTIFKKFEKHLEAVDVLITRLEDLDRAEQYAERVDVADVWSALAVAQLDSVMVKESIDSYIKAKDSSNFATVIQVANQENKHDDLVRFLEMARKTKKERTIDSELIYALARCERLADLEVFVTNPNVADIQGVADRCFDQSMFKAAKILYGNAGNNAKLATTLVRLGEFKEAVEAAKKANSLKTWQDVSTACVKAGEFRLAQVAGLKVIVSPDHLDELVHVYEIGCHFDELMELLELGQSGEQTHQGIFTELGVQYSRHASDKLMEHIKVFWQRMNVSRMLTACESGRHWAEAAYLHVQTEEHDSAVRVMMEHSPSAFKNDQFLEIIKKVRNTELHYSAIAFYLEEEPMTLENLLKVLVEQLDHSRVVHFMRKHEEHMPLIMPYLKSVQSKNITAVNEAVNDILIEEENFEALRESIDAHDAYDQLDLAKRLEKHELLEFRRIAALVYKHNKRYETSIDLSKSDNMFQDAVETAATSESMDLVEDLMRFFIEKDDKESFAAVMYTCYNLVRPDVALELAWRAGITDYVMPYMIQFLRDTSELVKEVDTRTKPKKSGAEAEVEHAAAAAAYGMAPGMGGQMLLTNAPYQGGGAPHGGMPGPTDAYAQAAQAGAYGQQGMAPPPPAGYNGGF